MKTLILILSIAFLLASCSTTTSEVSPEEVQSTVQQLQNSLHVGLTTFDEIKKKLGEPAESNALGNGKSATWKWTYAVARTIGSVPVTMKNFDSSNSSGMYHHVENRTSILEAVFDNEGVLTNFILK